MNGEEKDDLGVPKKNKAVAETDDLGVPKKKYAHIRYNFCTIYNSIKSSFSNRSDNNGASASSAADKSAATSVHAKELAITIAIGFWYVRIGSFYIGIIRDGSAGNGSAADKVS